ASPPRCSRATGSCQAWGGSGAPRGWARTPRSRWYRTSWSQARCRASGVSARLSISISISSSGGGGGAFSIECSPPLRIQQLGDEQLFQVERAVNHALLVDVLHERLERVPVARHAIRERIVPE